MNFPSIDIQGSILSTDLLAKIRGEQATFQQGKDFNADLTNAKLKDEISLAWQDAKGQWTIYKSKLGRLKEGEAGTTETRNFWISPLLTNLGYNLTFNRQSEELNGKSFPIGFRDSSLDNFPVYVGGYHESLDKRPENKQLRVSPHALVQEYLNYSEHLYGMATNGRQLRLLRDASRITRLSYLEFNLEKMMEEDLYSDFVILYRVLHASRMPKKIDAGAESIMEKYHQEGLEAGSTIRNKLGEAVKGAIKNLANGFINHPNNAALREAVAAGNVNTDEYYRHQLRIIYRLLFLFVIEERNLIYSDSKTPETKRFNQIYFNYYSLLRLRKLAKKLPPPEANRHYDLWQSLVSTFSLFEQKEIGEKLGIMSLQGDLFGYHAISNSQYDLHQCYLSNSVLLNILKSLSYFENDNGVLIAVNYGGLDVEEFGSVYEGLLELKLEFNKVEGSDNYSVNWQKQAGGREFQSHYTPEELVQPLIKHSLEYLIEDILLLYTQKKVSKESTINALLKLKVCDVACGSGHILLSAARRIALAVARMQTEEEQPNPLSIRKAMKDVVRNCIYGVDKNPLAVELCKIALWLEAYNPGEPLNFLDHHIKCGDAIVGLAHRSELEKGIADEAFKTLTVDNKDIAKTWRDKNVKERKERVAKSLQLKAEFEKTTENSVQEAMAEYKTFNQLPETTPDETKHKAKAYKKFIDGKGFTFLKAMADTQIAQFFIPKTDANKEYLMTDADFRLILSGYKGWQDRKVAKATAVALEQRFFHWFIEFPEVFNEGGFDCVLGNPPFLGGKKISGNYGDDYLSIIKYYYFPVEGGVDLVGYFFRRIYYIIKNEGFQSLISTNTIAQGDTKKASLEYISSKSGTINFAIKSTKWPGVATLEVSLVCIFKGNWKKKIFLGSTEVISITPFLDDNKSNNENPFCLYSNQKKSFQGTIVLGTGFILDKDEATTLLKNSMSNAKVILPYLNGDDLNSTSDATATRQIINFYNWEEDYCKKNYFDCYTIVQNKVKPQRDILKDKGYREKWWQYGRRAVDMYDSIKNKTKVIAIAQVTKPVAFEFVNTNQVLDAKLIVFDLHEFNSFAVLQSSMHNSWCWNYCTTLETRLSYAPTSLFETFPFPPNINSEQKWQLETIGEAYHEHRRQLMMNMQLGLTKTYNLFHCNAITTQGINDKDKQVASLQKHFEKTANTISFDEAIKGILKLREIHVQMDEAVLDAYGWNDIALKHDFYEVDYLPENDRVRFTIHPDARKEVLKRLLELNHKIHEEEVKAGLWNKKKTSKKQPMPLSKKELGYVSDLLGE
ncbi:Eco57I restriction-modification methylase domain-containing protein [Dyadobacter sp. CY351]|uniref:Eco57I restriction-modification methylase domain-containing protein n=1 Tax=Dyadobacter sp. CY351 TaxID=2909337 RepID=UPI001F3572F0|nr:DNA methyltransferase [Dyadobacter sp. CY351]MCF2518524.1 restriction endonuclease [Dyadobacter sp. CY351]